MADEVVMELPGVVAMSVINQRRCQQDGLAFGDGWWAVADGMGGHPQGEVAASVALHALAAAIGDLDTVEQLQAAVVAADAEVKKLADSSAHRLAPGSTLVVAARTATGVVGAWCGDSSAWWVRSDGDVEALTVPHQCVGGGLSACLGDHGDEFLRVDRFSLPGDAQGLLVLVSDGADPVWVAGEAGELLTTGGVPALVAAACEAGGDNVTVVAVDLNRWSVQQHGEVSWARWGAPAA